MVEESQARSWPYTRSREIFYFLVYIFFKIHKGFQLGPTFSTIPTFLLLFGPSRSQLKSTVS